MSICWNSYNLNNSDVTDMTNSHQSDDSFGALLSIQAVGDCGDRLQSLLFTSFAIYILSAVAATQLQT
jgi:hypothetical protein